MAVPPKIPSLTARLLLRAVPKWLRAVEYDLLVALPRRHPRAMASLLLMATPPIVAATLSLSAIACPPR